MGKVGVFIIESLKLEDEEKNRFEGKFLSHILDLGNIKSAYYYIRTKKELEKIIKEYKKSDFRYLHLSCHGNKASVSTTLEKLSFVQLRNTINTSLKDKRLFVSACLAVNDDLAKALMPITKCFSIIGFSKSIGFDEAAIIWASFYHLMFKADNRSMSRKNILQTIRNIARTFEIPLVYYSRSATSETGYKKTEVDSKGQIKKFSK